ncbi:MAG: glycosyltransferase family 2 protein [Gemmataceae bacterium]
MASSATTPAVTILIVNYNGKHYLHDCLTALERQTYPRSSWEVVLVDNASADGSVAYVREHFPWVKVTSLSRNRGFAGGNNVGMRRTQAPYVALLNNDTVVDADWLAALVEVMEQEPRIGGVASKILFRHEPTRINNAGLLLYRDGHGADRGFREMDDGQYDEPAEVFGGCGASVLLRRAMLDDVGLFDERLFMYYEDTDLAWRARARGWRFCYTPRSRVWHVHCGSSGEWSPFFLYYVERNRVWVNWKNAPPRLALRVSASFSWRVVRQWWRVLSSRERHFAWRQAIAYTRAAWSLAIHAPLILAQRLWLRGWRRTISDQELDHLLTTVPARRSAA